MIGRLVGCVVLGLAALPVVAAEDINFSDLQRPGAGLSRSAIVPGLADEGANFITRFSEVDKGRVEDLRRLMTSSSGTSHASESSSSTTKGGGKRADASSRTSAEPEKSGSIERIKEFWLLKDENKAIVVRCANGREKSYNYFPKTGRYCTTMMTCNSSEEWVQRAVCY